MKAVLFQHRKSMGFGRSAGFLFLIALAAVWAGGQGIYTAARNQRPLTLSYEEYVRSKPQAQWLNLTNCELDLFGASYEERAGRKEISKVYVPLRNGPGDTQVHVLLATEDPRLRNALEEIVKLTSPEQSSAWLVKHGEKFSGRRAVCGLVQFGMDMNSTKQAHLAKLHKQDLKQLIIISEGERPSWTASVAMLAFGLIVSAIILLGGKQEPAAARDD